MVINILRVGAYPCSIRESALCRAQFEFSSAMELKQSFDLRLCLGWRCLTHQLDEGDTIVWWSRSRVGGFTEFLYCILFI